MTPGSRSQSRKQWSASSSRVVVTPIVSLVGQGRNVGCMAHGLCQRPDAQDMRGGTKADRFFLRFAPASFLVGVTLRSALRSDSSVLYLLAALLVAFGASGRLARVQICASTHGILKQGKRWVKGLRFVVVAGLLAGFVLPVILGIEAALPSWGVWRMAIGLVGGWVLWWFVTTAAAWSYSTRPRNVLRHLSKAQSDWPLKLARWLRRGAGSGSLGASGESSTGNTTLRSPAASDDPIT
jgi:hypothetical protein